MVDEGYVEPVDVAVVGGGILGLSTAHSLLRRHAGLKVTVLEKEGGLAPHQTGHNSGVIHSGIYYPPGSLKARLAIEGGGRLVKLCESELVRFFCEADDGSSTLASIEGKWGVIYSNQLLRRWCCAL